MRGERRRPTPHLGDRLHARNRYKDNPPDFYALGQSYPSILPHLRNVDHEKKTAALAFDDPYAVRELTTTLLKHDFGLEWTIPIDRLCPPLPNRLNYIHWIEDLLHDAGVDPFGSVTSSDSQRPAIRGIDIGTGASCIYALLGAKMNGWSFVATEIDEISHRSAVDNVARNGLAGQIHVQRVATTQLLLEPLRDVPSDFKNHPVSFSMCNPPFFGNEHEADTNPDAACMGSTTEMVCPGGEVAFIGDMVNDSLVLRERVLIYTSMIGRKSSLRKVLALLRQKGIENVCSTEFFQGRTKRWGVAWSFSDKTPLKTQAKVLGKRKEAHRQQELQFYVPRRSDADYGCESRAQVVERVREFVQSVKNYRLQLTSHDEGGDCYRLTCSITDAATDNDIVFQAIVEVDDEGDDPGFCVTIEYLSGKRDECWRVCESIKAATIRSGRQWRRKRNRPSASETVTE